jgi:hypothetical protein
MITSVLHFASGTLLVLSAWILYGIPNAAWPVMGAAGITFYFASIQSYFSARRQRPDQSKAAFEEHP